MKKQLTWALSNRRKTSMTSRGCRTVALTIACLLVGAGGIGLLYAKAAQKNETQLIPMGTTKGLQYRQLVIRNAMMVTGRGTPASGPVDIVIDRDRISKLVLVDGVSLSSYGPSFKRPEGDRVIDATGMYVLPGLVDMHAHVPGKNMNGTGDQGTEYAYRLWLGNGFTTLRDPGCNSGMDITARNKQLSQQNKIVAPRLVLYKGFEGKTPEDARTLVRQYRNKGADGIKVISSAAHYPDVLEAICAEAKKLGMGVAVDLKLDESNAVMASNAGVTSIEHWYGIPDAAMRGRQRFPGDYNYLNEGQRFREASRLWAEADAHPEKILEVLDLMIKNGTVWDPTMAVYEPNRDLTRVLNLPWRANYATPGLIEHWAPNPAHHASFHAEWTTTDEAYWRQNYQLWMKYVKAFYDRGGTLTVGSDAGTQQALYGFTTVRELELMQEAGLNPINIVQIATTNATRALGLKDLAGIRPGQIADLIVVDGNPLINFKVLYGTGYDRYTADGTKEHRGGVRWTIKSGIVFDAPALLREVEWYVNQEKQGRTTKP